MPRTLPLGVNTRPGENGLNTMEYGSFEPQTTQIPMKLGQLVVLKQGEASRVATQVVRLVAANMCILSKAQESMEMDEYSSKSLGGGGGCPLGPGKGQYCMALTAWWCVPPGRLCPPTPQPQPQPAPLGGQPEWGGGRLSGVDRYADGEKCKRDSGGGGRRKHDHVCRGTETEGGSRLANVKQRDAVGGERERERDRDRER